MYRARVFKHTISIALYTSFAIGAVAKTDSLKKFDLDKEFQTLAREVTDEKSSDLRLQKIKNFRVKVEKEKENPKLSDSLFVNYDILTSALEVAAPLDFKKENCEKIKTSLFFQFSPQEEQPKNNSIRKAFQILEILCK